MSDKKEICWFCGMPIGTNKLCPICEGYRDCRVRNPYKNGEQHLVI